MKHRGRLSETPSDLGIDAGHGEGPERRELIGRATGSVAGSLSGGEQKTVENRPRADAQAEGRASRRAFDRFLTEGPGGGLRNARVSLGWRLNDPARGAEARSGLGISHRGAILDSVVVKLLVEGQHLPEDPEVGRFYLGVNPQEHARAADEKSH